MEITRIKSERFFNPLIGAYIQPKGRYCLKDERGFVGFKDSPYTPYFPGGGKKTLQSILDDGGFTSESDLVFIQPMATEYAHGA